MLSHCSDTQQLPHNRLKSNEDVLQLTRANVPNPGAIPLTTTHYTRAAKVRGVGLPQEQELARLFSNITNSLLNWSASVPACKWKGITCKNGIDVSEISCRDMALEGTLALQYMPRTVSRFYALRTHLQGVLQLDLLPSKITHFDVCNNLFHGSLDLIGMPNNLIDVSACINQFTGSADLVNLSKCLEVIELQGNLLSGDINLTALPRKMFILDLSRNLFTGSLNLDKLPLSLLSLRLNNNIFSGWILLNNLPKQLNTLLLNGNLELYGEVNRSTLPESLFEFKHDDKISIC